MKHKCFTKTANINVQKLTSLNLVLRTTKTTPVKPQISKFKAEKSFKWALTCDGGSPHERLLSESSHSYMLAYHLSVFVLLATVLSTFRTDRPRLELVLNLVQIVLGQCRPTRHNIQTKC